ncbi:squalene epoxidase [Russula emetica]|nr:squalene epoxidase [Russula emetica]
MPTNIAHGSSYDVVIVGAGIVVGSAFAHALSVAVASTSRAAPLRTALLESSLAEPDRIPPGGVTALRSGLLGLIACLEGIDATPVHCAKSRSFYRGCFIQNLRAHARVEPGVDLVEATATDLIECPLTCRIVGVRTGTHRNGAEQVSFCADLVGIIADGCFFKFRSTVTAGGALSKRSVVRGNFVRAVLEDVSLPIPQHGTIVLVKGHGPVLLYQTMPHILIDVQNPLPSNLKQCRSHTNEGVIFLRDAWNMLMDVLHRWHWARKPLVATSNILGVALHDHFGAEDKYPASLRTECFKYLERGGENIRGPVSLISGLAPDPILLFNRFSSVARYSTWVLLTYPRHA